MKGQRTGFKTRYAEETLMWGHWVGSTILLRPEIRFDHASRSSRLRQWNPQEPVPVGDGCNLQVLKTFVGQPAKRAALL